MDLVDFDFDDVLVVILPVGDDDDRRVETFRRRNVDGVNICIAPNA